MLLFTTRCCEENIGSELRGVINSYRLPKLKVRG